MIHPENRMLFSSVQFSSVQSSRSVVSDSLRHHESQDEMDLIDIFKTLYPNAKEYTFFSSSHGTFSRIDLDHKLNLSKFKKIEIISSIFSNHNTMRLDLNYKKKAVRNTNTWRLNNTFLNNHRLMKKSKGKLKNF